MEATVIYRDLNLIASAKTLFPDNIMPRSTEESCSDIVWEGSSPTYDRLVYGKVVGFGDGIWFGGLWVSSSQLSCFLGRLGRPQILLHQINKKISKPAPSPGHLTSCPFSSQQNPGGLYLLPRNALSTPSPTVSVTLPLILHACQPPSHLLVALHSATQDC